MLPNLRTLITATLSTFLLTAAAGLFVSLRLAQEPLTMRSDARGAFDESPINRISLSWSLPELGRAAALRELPPLPANVPAPGSDEETARAIDAPPESAVAEPAKPEPQLASRSEEVAEPQTAPPPPIEELQIATRAVPEPPTETLLAPAEIPNINNGDDQPAPASAPEATGAIGEPAQSLPAAGVGAKPASLPHDSRPQAGKAQSKKRVTQRKRANTHRIASRQFRLLTPQAGAKFNTAAPFLFFGPASEP
jgi:hypothetical protein